MPSNPPPTSYSDKVGYRDHVDDDIEALASRALSPISDFPPNDDYDDMDHSITSSDDDDDDDDDLSLSDEEGQRDVMALHKKTSDILNDFEDFVQNVNDASSPAKEIMSTIISGNNNKRGVESVKNRITAGGGDAVLNRDWSYNDRNLHDVGFGSDDDERRDGGGSPKYEKGKRGLFKYAVPFFHSKKFKFIAVGVAVVFVLVLIAGSMSNTPDRVEVEELDDVVKWFYEQTECNDHPSAEVHGEGHGCAWIHTTGRVPLRHARCGHDTTYKKKNGEFLLVKEVCKKSCDECGGTESSAAVETEQEAPKPEEMSAAMSETQSEGLEPAVQQTTAQEPQEEMANSGEMTNWMTPVTLNNDSSSPITSSADCKDDLTKVVAIGGKNCETYFSDSNLQHLKELRCSHQTDIDNGSGGFLFVRDVCKMSCGLCGVESDPSINGQIMEAPSTVAVEEASAPLDVLPNDVVPSIVETEQAQSNAEPASAVAETTLLDSVTSPASAAAETTPLESVSSPASAAAETTPLESVSSSSTQSSTEATASVFTRQEGWTGFSRSAAIGFCSEKGLSLCTFEAVCPQGEGNAPAFGVSVEVTWVPLSDGNDWVQVGAGAQGPCDQWSKTHVGSPPWANAGEVIEQITRNLYCCEGENPAQDAGNPTEDIAISTIEDTQSIPASTAGLSEQQAYNHVANQFVPQWFDRSSGWQGTTFEAAVQFCLSLDQILCPYEAYCPMGPNSKVPFGGFRDDGSLAPAITNRNWWVHVGGTNVCEHADLDVNWGSDGSNEEVTRHIMCCKNGN